MTDNALTALNSALELIRRKHKPRPEGEGTLGRLARKRHNDAVRQCELILIKMVRKERGRVLGKMKR